MEKKRSVGKAVILLLALPLVCFGQDVITQASESKNNILPFKTAKITYKVKSNSNVGTKDGTEILYIDGDKIALEQFTTNRVDNIFFKESKRIIDDGNFVFDIDIIINKVVKIPLSGEHVYLIADYLEHEISNPDFYNVRNEKFLYKDCRVYEIAKGKGPQDVRFKVYKLHFYNGVLLRKEMDIDIEIEAIKKHYEIKEAVDVQFDIAIPKDKFELPKNAEVTDLSDLTEQLQ